MHLFIFRFRLKLYGNFALLRYIGPIANLYGENAIQAAQIDEWHECAPLLSQGSAFENACKYLDDYLGSRSFFVDHSFSVADILIWSSLLGMALLLSLSFPIDFIIIWHGYVKH